MESATRSATLFDVLGAAAWDEMRARMERRAYAPGDVIIGQGTLDPEFHVIVDGLVAVEASGMRGRRRELGTLGPGDAIGDMALLTGDPASADVIASSPVSTYAISRERLVALDDLRARLMEALAQLLAVRLRHANERLIAERSAVLHAIAGAPAVLPALSRLPAEVARVVDAPVLAVLLGDGYHGTGDAMAGKDVSVWNVSNADLSELPRALKRVSHEYDRILLFGAPAALSALAAEAGAPWHVLHEAEAVPPNATRIVQVTRTPGSHAEMHRRSARAGVSVLGLIPPESPPRQPRDPVARLARAVTGRLVGLALGAGAAKGLAHVGVLRAFVERDIPIDIISGCSIGSAIASAFAAGYTVDEIAQITTEVAQRALRPTLPIHSFLSSRGIRDELERVGRGKRFEDLDVPLAVCAVDIFRRCEVTFTEGLVWPRILASMAIPGVYPPLRSGDSYLVDGSVLTPVPARQCRDLGAGIVIGVRLTGARTSPREILDYDPSRPIAADTITRCFEIMHNRLSELSRNDADVTIEVQLEKGGIRDFDRMAEFSRAGHDATLGAIDELASVMPYVKETA